MMIHLTTVLALAFVAALALSHPFSFSDVHETREECYVSCEEVKELLGQGACFRGCRARFPDALSDVLIRRMALHKKSLAEKLLSELLSDSTGCPASCKTKCDPSRFSKEMQAAGFHQACYKGCCEDEKGQ